ncbi:hypothetical protein ACFLXU_03110 [Chloroflexota bacterium]
MIITFLISIFLALVIATGIVLLLQARKRMREGNPVKTNYRTLYNFGKYIVPFGILITIVFFALQIPFYAGLPILVLGVLYLIVGYTNREKWH